MANHLNPASKQKVITGALDWTGGTWRAQFVDDTFTSDLFDAAEFASDIIGALGSAEAITTRVALLGGVGDADDVIPGPTLAIGETAAAVVIYKDTGSLATSPLWNFMDTNDDGTPVDVVGDGTARAIIWSDTADRIFRL